jgi:hypothetical protein
MLTVTMLLLLAAFVCTVLSALGKAPLWVAVVFLCVLELVEHLPLK